jgi:hypothetical protein
LNTKMIKPPGYDCDDVFGVLGGSFYDYYPHLQKLEIDLIARHKFNRHIKRPSHVIDKDRVIESRAIAFFVRTYLAWRCFRPGCSNVWTNRGALKYCAGCRVAVYCSVRCQKLAWKHETAGHRHVCRPIGDFCAKFGISRHFLSDESEPVPQDESHTQLAQIIVDHFVALTKAEMATTGE